MAAGVPVIATDIPGSRDLIQAEKNGWLVPARQPDSLANMILAAIESPEKGRLCSIQARKDVEQFTIRSTVKKYSALYDELLG